MLLSGRGARAACPPLLALELGSRLAVACCVRLTQEITRDEWHPFFDAFSGMHHGWPVTLEVRGPSPDGEVKASEVPLEEIAAELSVREEGRISIVLRPTQENEISHVIDAPTHVWLSEGEDEPDVSLEIASAFGTTTLIKVRQLELPKPEPELFS